MTFFPEPFDPAEETGGGTTPPPVPPGEYQATIIEADVRAPKSGDGHMLSLRWRIQEGQHEDRLIFQTCMLQHSSEVAQKIGRAMVKDLCDALGLKAAVKDSDDFLYKSACIKVGVEKDKSGVYGDRNKVLKILPANGQSNGGHTPSPPPKAPTGASSSPPWARG